MKQTLLDEYISTCVGFAEAIPMYRAMSQVIQDTTPVAHSWNGWADCDRVELPPREIAWPDSAMCLYSKAGITAGYHTFAVDVGYAGEKWDAWFNDRKWGLAGTLLFQKSPTYFEVVPIVKQIDGHLVVNDVQLTMELESSGWVGRYAKVGPANHLFYNVFLANMPDDDGRDTAIDAASHLGAVMSQYLGSYWEHLQHPGHWNIHPAKAPKVRIKKQRIKEQKPGTMGYKEYEHGETPNPSADNAECG